MCLCLCPRQVIQQFYETVFFSQWINKMPLYIIRSFLTLCFCTINWQSVQLWLNSCQNSVQVQVLVSDNHMNTEEFICIHAIWVNAIIYWFSNRIKEGGSPYSWSLKSSESEKPTAWCSDLLFYLLWLALNSSCFPRVPWKTLRTIYIFWEELVSGESGNCAGSSLTTVGLKWVYLGWPILNSFSKKSS